MLDILVLGGDFKEVFGKSSYKSSSRSKAKADVCDLEKSFVT